jgi:serine phosphatase RsbU (regulator of sigma subunit)
VPGDLVLAYTDGVIEVSGPSGQEWGIDGLLQAAEAGRREPVDELVRSLFDSMDVLTLWIY